MTDIAVKKGIDAFWLKVVAIIGMTCNHIGHVFGPNLEPLYKALLYLPGGLTFPIMAFLLIEGFRKTRNLKRYMLRLLLFGAVALLPFVWALFTAFNVLITLFLGLLTLALYERLQRKWVFVLAFIGITLFTALCDWGFIGVPLVFAMYKVQGEKRRVILPIAVMALSLEVMLAASVFLGGTSLDAALPDMAFMIGCLCAIPLLLSYNGQRGRDMKFFFYAYYPAHLIALALLRGFFTGVWWR